MINKSIGFCQPCLCFPYGCEDDRHVLVAFVVLTMRCYVCALLSAVSARLAFVLLLPLRRSEQFFFHSQFFCFCLQRVFTVSCTYIHTCILT